MPAFPSGSPFKKSPPLFDFFERTTYLETTGSCPRALKEKSFLYRAFDATGELSTAAEAALETEFNGEKSRFLSAWNGELEERKGATMALGFHENDWPAWSFEISDVGGGMARLGIEGVKELVLVIAVCLRPVVITVARTQYFKKQVFKDRLGVGWMLYLPRILTVQHAPEAHALVPVVATDGKGDDSQIGTIVVSVNNQPFSDENPTHVKIANAIEIHLVEQDLLLRYSDI